MRKLVKTISSLRGGETMKKSNMAIIGLVASIIALLFSIFCNVIKLI